MSANTSADDKVANVISDDGIELDFTRDREDDEDEVFTTDKLENLKISDTCEDDGNIIEPENGADKLDGQMSLMCADAEECEELDPTKFLLNTGWTMYFVTKSKTQLQWKDGRSAYPGISNVCQFWQTVHSAPLPTELNVKNRESIDFFREGIAPEWESPRNAGGGMFRAEFTYETKQSKAAKEELWEKRNGLHVNTMWIELLMALVGEQFEHSHLITGCIFARRQTEDRIQLWTTDLSGPNEEEIKKTMAKQLRQFLNVEGAINYQTHAELQDQSRQTFGKRGTYARSQSYAGKPRK